MRAALLWTHVLSGVVWIGACACLAMAISALATGSEEFRDFATRVVPRLNRLNLAAAITLVVTGVARLLMLVVAGGFVPSTMFIDVLGMKVGLFAVMAMALGGSWRAEAALRAADINTAESAIAPTRRLVVLSGLTALLGGAALGLGLWLVGS